MGLIRAAKNAIGSTFRDQYAEYIECPSLAGSDYLVVRGKKQIFAGGTNMGDDNVITDGSIIAVADGQCMIIVEDGKIIDFCVGNSQADTAGQYIYNTGTAPSMLTGGFEGLKKSFSMVWERIKTGGQIGHTQRVYYVNMLEIMDNKFGLGNLHFRDAEFNFTVNCKCHGAYTYKIVDPIIFYTNVCGNSIQGYKRNDSLDGQLKNEFISVLGDSISEVSRYGIPYDQIRHHDSEITAAVNNRLREKWLLTRGIEVQSIAIIGLEVDEGSAKKIEQFQTDRVYSNADVAAGKLLQADADAKLAAASNAAGSYVGFTNLDLANRTSSTNTSDVFAMAQQMKMQEMQMKMQEMQMRMQMQEQMGGMQQNGFTQQTADSYGNSYQQPQLMEGNPTMDSNVEVKAEDNLSLEPLSLEAPANAGANVNPVVPATTASADGWKCVQCGAENKGKFCVECGTPAPAPEPVQKPSGWKCIKCGTDNFGKFCMECGSPKPLDSKCETCGFEGDQPFKFCPECGAENKI